MNGLLQLSLALLCQERWEEAIAQLRTVTASNPILARPITIWAMR